MKKSAIILLSILPFTLLGQNHAEEISVKVCQCIYGANKSESLGVIVRDCIHKETSDPTVFDEVYQRLYETCPAIAFFSSEKQAQFYALSKSKEANEHYNKGNSLLNQQNYKKAIQEFQKAMEYDHQFVFALDHISLCYRKLGDLEESIKYNQKSLDIYPEGDIALTNRAAIYSFQKDYPQALKYYKQLAAFHPNNPEGYYGQADICLKTKDYETGLKNLSIAHKLYQETNSPYLKDTEKLIVYYKNDMTADKKEDLFNQKIKEYNLKVTENLRFSDLPNIIMKEKEDYKPQESNVLLCAKFLLSTPMDNQYRPVVSSFIFRWMMGTPDYKYDIDDDVTKLINKDNEKESLLPVYMAALAMYSLENPNDAGNKSAMKLNAFKITLDYAANKAFKVKQTSEVKKLIKAKKEGALEKELKL